MSEGVRPGVKGGSMGGLVQFASRTIRALPASQVNADVEKRDRICAEEQSEENELCYVAWGAYLYDSISALLDGMRCTESK